MTSGIESRPSIVVVGVGGVGKEVLSQLSLPNISALSRVDLVANSKYQVTVPLDTKAQNARDLLKLLPPSSISNNEAFQGWTQDPQTGAVVSEFTLAELVETVADRAKSRPHIFIDCTSDNGLAGLYPKLLAAGVHIATPSKKAFSGSQDLYDAIKKANSAGGLIYQEATVGAGLPIIGTLKTLVETGDKIKKIEGVLSGTLSYIFNEFSKPGNHPAPKFSDVVKIAKDKGYTEPHPGDDLNGSDVARKVCILARLTGASTLPAMPNGFESVPTESLVPKELADISSGAEFVERLPEFDAHFEQLRSAAAAKQQVLRFVALIDVEQGVVKAGLEKYAFTHPFAASLSGADNIISFTTERYPIPLVIQGAGAGGAVTAMGVVGDVLQILGHIHGSK